MSDDDTRQYNSPLREARARQTRERILEAAAKLIGEGAHKMTVPNVAREAGVAVPTVYRYFSSKEELEDGVVSYVKELVGIIRRYDGLDELAETIARNWTAPLPPGVEPLLLASIGRRLDEPPNEGRRAHVRSGLQAELDAMTPEDAERFALLVEAFASTLGRVALMRTGLSPAVGADVMGWMLRTLHDSLSED